MAGILDTFSRMCKTFEDCSKCPLTIVGNESCLDILRDTPKVATKIIQDWGVDNPFKSYLQDFMEKFPGAKTVDKVLDGLTVRIPTCCRYDIYGRAGKDPCLYEHDHDLIQEHSHKVEVNLCALCWSKEFGK